MEYLYKSYKLSINSKTYIIYLYLEKSHLAFLSISKDTYESPIILRRYESRPSISEILL